MTLSSTCESNIFITNLIRPPDSLEHCYIDHNKSSETPGHLQSNTVHLSNLRGESSKERMESNSEDSDSESLLNVEVIDD